MLPQPPTVIPLGNPPPYTASEPSVAKWHIAMSTISPKPFTSKPFTPNPALILQKPPPLDPAWLAHEAALPVNSQPAATYPEDPQKSYSEACKALNSHLLSGRDGHLNDGIKIFDTCIETRPDTTSFPCRESASTGYKIPVRTYNPSSSPSVPLNLLHGKKVAGVEEEEGKDIVIYYHGGGLYVGDLDSEDLTCRRICKMLGCSVYSVGYRLMPEFSANVAYSDALTAFLIITGARKARRLIVMGSSSGGQLAAMISHEYRPYKSPTRKAKIHGVCLRGPVLCDATEAGKNLPARLREFHTSMSEGFHTSLLAGAALNAGNRTDKLLPLEVDEVAHLPRHWIQVCTNDIYYSDGALYAEVLREAGVDVKLNIVEGWPHTFWLKAPELGRAVKADADMIEGLRWLLESNMEDEQTREEDEAEKGPRSFVPFTDEEFERKFNGY